MIKALISMFLFACGCVGCGAFADAVEPIENLPNLKIEPDSMRQGQRKEFLISFLEAPPWSGDTGGNAFIIDYDWGGNDLQTEGFEYNLDDDTVDLVLVAQADAKINERVLKITAGFQKAGSKQQSYRAWGYFSILRAIPVAGAQESNDGGP